MTTFLLRLDPGAGDGPTVAVKDLIDIAGTPTTCASRPVAEAAVDEAVEEQCRQVDRPLTLAARVLGIVVAREPVPGGRRIHADPLVSDRDRDRGDLVADRDVAHVATSEDSRDARGDCYPRVSRRGVHRPRGGSPTNKLCGAAVPAAHHRRGDSRAGLCAARLFIKKVSLG